MKGAKARERKAKSRTNQPGEKQAKERDKARKAMAKRRNEATNKDEAEMRAKSCACMGNQVVILVL